MVVQVFFETPCERYYCDIIQYMFLFVSVSVNVSLSPPKKIQSVTPMVAAVSFISAPSKYIEHSNIGVKLQTDTEKGRSNKTTNIISC